MPRTPTIRVLGRGVVSTEPDAGELGIAPEARSSSGVWVQEEFDYGGDGRRSLGHRATSTLVVRMTDVALIGALIMRAGDELDATIGGPTWTVSPGHPAFEQAARRAAANAADKAAAYAEGVGMRRGALVGLSEPKDDRYATPLARAASAPRGGGDMPVASGEHAVTATIWATFELVGG